MKNDPDLWVRADSVYEPIVERALFDAAQQIIRNRSRKMTNDEMLRSLRELLVCAGSLSGLIIDESEGCPSSSVYRSRFGNLLRAYQLVGYTPHRDYRYIEINRALRRFYPDVIADVVQGIENAGGIVVCNSVTELLEINGEFSASIVIARCRETAAGAMRWKVRLDRGLMPDVTIVVRMNLENILPYDYLILPSLDMSEQVLRIQEHNGIALDTYRFDSLDHLFEMAERISLKEAA